MAAYKQLDLHIVTPSHWLAEAARKSTLLSHFPVHVIPNPHPVDIYSPHPQAAARAKLGLAADAFILLFAAQHLDDERKGGIFLVEMLRKLAQSPLARQTMGLLLGNSPSQAFLQTGIAVRAVGNISQEETMALLYSAADAVLVPSLEDNFPNVICEALACGTPVLAFASGGIPEMILHQKTGWLAPVRDVDSLLEGVFWAEQARRSPLTRRLCRAHALERWNPEKCAAAYAELYAQACGITWVHEK